MAPTKINATFSALSWHTQEPRDPDPPFPYTFARMDVGFDSDDMKGKGMSCFIISNHADADNSNEQESSTSYDGQVLFDGTIKGRKGTVVLRETGNTLGGDVHGKWTIASETATGELKGIKGKGGYFMKAKTADKPIAGELEVEFE